MNRKLKSTTALILSCVMFYTMTMGVFATESQADVTAAVMVETRAGKKENIPVSGTETTVQQGGNTVTKTVLSADDYVTESNMTVDYKSESNMTVDRDNIETGTFEDSYKAESTDGYYKSEGGSQSKTEKQTFEQPVEVDVPLTDKAGKNTAETVSMATGSTVTGKESTDDTDGVYDYTITTVTAPQKVTVTTSGISYTEKTVELDKPLSYLTTSAVQSADTDLRAPYSSHTSISDGISKIKDGYNFIYLGVKNQGRYWPGFICRLTREDNLDEEPLYTDKYGTPYYVWDQHSIFVDRNLVAGGYYIHGEYVPLETPLPARYGNTLHFLLTDRQGSSITAYCVDRETEAEKEFNYNIFNVEDAGYYTPENARKIQSIATSGYWGTASGIGSLAEFRKMLQNKTDIYKETVTDETTGEAVRKYTPEDVTDGIAMIATQMAIWHYSNESGSPAFVTAYHVNADKSPLSLKAQNHTNPDKDTTDLIFRIKNYLVSLPEYQPQTRTTRNTIINPDHFLKSVKIAVKDKTESDTENVYTTDISVQLAVSPVTVGENIDDLVITILDENSNVLAKGRIAGEPEEGETVISSTGNNVYTFTDVSVPGGEQKINFNITGAQYLEQGTYLLTSETKQNEDGTDVSSQSMLCVASGYHGINLTMNLSLELQAEEGVVKTERVWRKETILPTPTPAPTPTPTPVPTPTPTPEPKRTPAPTNTPAPTQTPPPPQTPDTGDRSFNWAVPFFLSLAGVSVLLINKKRSK